MTGPGPHLSGAVCCRCGRRTDVPVEVGYHERQSGPGVAVYACPEHAVVVVPGPVPGELERDV
ncbi:hypothetical protein C5L38_13055 [Streptomyces sp. WAC00288]|nr:hypothetical protein C5L38_13055 [Streptomyces sp. WAC00288]PVC74800.1 hypothetical protein DBP18_10715 [Streptomyces sp. CS081A]